MKYSYSFSRLKDHENCAQFFKFKHIDKKKYQEPDHLRQGDSIHEIIRKYTLACFERGVSHLHDEWESICDEVLAKKNLPSNIENEVKLVISDFVSSSELDLTGLAGVEEQISLDESYKSIFWDTAWFRAKIDKLHLIGENCKITDYKTGFSLQADQFQLEIYAWVINKIYPHVRYFEIELDFIRFHHKKIFHINHENLPQIERKILGRIQEIEKDQDFKPTPSSKCAECQFWQICPAMKNEKIERTPTSHEEAQKTLQNILALEKQLKETKRLLKSYCEEAGKVIQKDIRAEVRAITTKHWDIEKVLRWANDNDLYILDSLSVDTQKIKKHNPPENLAEESLSTRFMIGKDGKPDIPINI